MNKIPKKLWADEFVESEEQLNDPAQSSDGYLSACSSLSVGSALLSTKRGEPSRRRLCNQPLLRDHFQQLQEKNQEKISSASLGYKGSMIEHGSTSSYSSNGSRSSPSASAVRLDPGHTDRRSQRKLRNLPLPKGSLPPSNSESSSGRSGHSFRAAPAKLGDDDSGSLTSRVSDSGSWHQTSVEEVGETGDIESEREVLDCLPSVGSGGHETQTCRPCLFVHTEAGCHKGASCGFCHFRHRRKERARPCKSKRERYRSLIARKAVEGESGSTTPSAEFTETESQE